jgi:transposase
MPPEEIDSLNADSLKGLVLSLLAKIDDLVEQNKALLARIAELEGRAGKPPKTPTNSSVPPSRGQKANVSDASATKKGRKGHPGVARELLCQPRRDARYLRRALRLRRETARRRSDPRARL